MTKSLEWEKKCRRCGRCCFEKIDYNGIIQYTDIPCDMLDLETRLCSVYAERHVRRPGCTPLTPKVLQRGILPADCPYVAEIVDYPAPSLFDESDDPEE